MFQLTFPQEGMLTESQVEQLARASADRVQLKETVGQIRRTLNPHPSGQHLNVPQHDGAALRGVQHKYRETVLYFPSQGQTCHSYCTYCFRWAQFIGDADLRFAIGDPNGLVSYLRDHTEIDDVLVTGGDPMVMSADRLASHLLPILDVESVRTIRIGTKSPAYWPYRFTDDTDADDILRIFQQIVQSGRQLAIMAHFSHPREIQNEATRKALSRIRTSGAMIYGQAPIVAHVNDKPEIWRDLWRSQIDTGVTPYYLFVERDTGPHEYFKVPLADAVRIYQDAYRTLPGLARTVRGPIMSATPGKIMLDGIEETPHGTFFCLKMVQARIPELVGRPFRAHFSATAAWIDELELDDFTPNDLAAAVHDAGHELLDSSAAAGPVYK
jgi:KamA family protein